MSFVPGELPGGGGEGEAGLKKDITRGAATQEVLYIITIYVLQVLELYLNGKNN